MKDRVAGILADLCPGAEIQVLPDYAAAYHALPAGTDIAVIAGTGSLVCSRVARKWAISGGRGWILGDHGSAARLGQSLLAWYAEDPTAVPHIVVAGIEQRCGTSNWREIVATVHSASAPAAVLAAAAPVLTEAAEAGVDDARRLLHEHMYALAHTTTRHAATHGWAGSRAQLGLVGGVWSSKVARESFADALAALGAPVALNSMDVVPDALDGAVRLALASGMEDS